MLAWTIAGLLALAEAKLDSGDVPAAEAAVREARVLCARAPAPACARLDRIEGGVREEQGLRALAIGAYGRALGHADDVSLRRRLAALLQTEGRAEEALAAWRAVADARTDDVGAHQALADLHQDRGERAAAMGALEAVARLRPDDPRPLRRLEELARAAGDAEAAAEYARRAEALAPRKKNMRPLLPSKR